MRTSIDISYLPRAERDALVSRVSTLGLGWMEARTVCLCHRVPGGNPVAKGSGVLLRVADVGFVITAGHVLQGLDGQGVELLVAPDAGDLGLYNLGDKTCVDIGRTRDLADVDLAFVKLPADTDAVLSALKSFVRLSEVELEVTASGGAYSVLGYPQQWAKFDAQAKTVSIRPVCYGADLHRHELVGSTNGLSLVLDFPQGLTEDVSGQSSRMPELQGISG